MKDGDLNSIIDEVLKGVTEDLRDSELIDYIDLLGTIQTKEEINL